MAKKKAAVKTKSSRGAHLEGKRVKFSKENQPTGKAKSEGWKKKRTGQELAKFILSQSFKGVANGNLKKAACEYFGVDEKHLTNEAMILMRVAEKAIQRIDIGAAKLLLERAHGLPKQLTEHSGEINMPPITGMIVK